MYRDIVKVLREDVSMGWLECSVLHPAANALNEHVSFLFRNVVGVNQRSYYFFVGQIKGESNGFLFWETIYCRDIS